MKTPTLILAGATLAVTCAVIAQQRGGPPGGRNHTALGAKPLELTPADAEPPAAPAVTIKVEGEHRHIISNGMPAHKIGAFPVRNNPNSVGPQAYDVKINAAPKPADQLTSVDRYDQPGPPNIPFGFAINGIFFEPGTAEFWHGDRSSGWNYDALGGAVPLGIDENYAHPQPNGAYHYHGLPTGLLKQLGLSPEKHSPLVGWAADGFPIYARYGYQDPKDPGSKIIDLRSSYRLKEGTRPTENDGPGGKYDGTFTRDFEYVEALGNLDECNGRFTITPEFPQGTYAYFLTENWPVVPRKFRAEPINIKMMPGGEAGGMSKGKGKGKGARKGGPGAKSK
jgi:hypothetical protein